ncbi:hypothetical protein EON65_12460 [archaeon]|nr:MAG: hypothetical protein EON65_12460 [archaeon]
MDSALTNLLDLDFLHIDKVFVSHHKEVLSALVSRLDKVWQSLRLGLCNGDEDHDVKWESISDTIREPQMKEVGLVHHDTWQDSPNYLRSGRVEISADFPEPYGNFCAFYTSLTILLNQKRINSFSLGVVDLSSFE